MNLNLPPHRSGPDIAMSDGRAALPIPMAIAGAALLSMPAWLVLGWVIARIG